MEQQLEELFESSVAFQPYPKYRTKKIQLVLISGKGGTGKTTAAKYLLGRLGEFVLATISPLAYPIKIIAAEFYKWNGDKTNEKGRRLLQEIGDTGRNYDEDIFVKYLEERELSGIFPNNFVLIDDWRYPNEKSYFENNFLYEVTTVRIERNSLLPGDTSNHISENSLPVAMVDVLDYNDTNYYNFQVLNYGTTEEFYKKLDSLRRYLFTKIISY